MLEISDEGVDPSLQAATTDGGEGTTVKCSFSAVALSPNLKSQYASAQMVSFPAPTNQVAITNQFLSVSFDLFPYDCLFFFYWAVTDSAFKIACSCKLSKLLSNYHG